MLTIKKAFLFSAISLALVGCDSEDGSNESISLNLRVMETTDLHGNVMPYDYFGQKKDESYGLARTALIIKEARAEVSNSMLFDNGDLIQGSPMADYMASLGADYLLKSRHPVYKAMNLLDYDAANIGNHEFNYGLEFLENAIEGANFPYIVANIFKYNASYVTTDNFASTSCETRIDEEFFDSAETVFDPYLILPRTFIGNDNEAYEINVGVIGFTPPNIMSWDKSYLECEIVVSDIKATAAYYVPKMKAEGADVIIAIPHSGLKNSDSNAPFADNATWQLAQIEGIDAIMFGHDHQNFPTDSDNYAGMDGVDSPSGKIYGKPAVMPGYWGNHLGVIDLVLESDDGNNWAVNYDASRAELRALPEDQLDGDNEILTAVANEHSGTEEFMQTPILGINQKINSFFSAIEPDLSVQIVNEAQYNWGKNLINDGVLAVDEGEILLSVSAPFKGGRGGKDDYTDINGTEITNGGIADLYVFDNNTPAVLKLTVADVKEWLETIAAQQYQTVSKDGDYLLHQGFRSYNLDVFYGGWDDNGNANPLHYTIDVSQPPRYLVDDSGNLEGDDPTLDPSDHHRISDITYKGETLDDSQVVYVVTNNYRASNNWIPGVNNAELVHEDAAFSNRELVDQYIKQLSEKGSDTNDLLYTHEFENADNFSLIAEQGRIVTFLSSPKAEEYAGDVPSITFTDKLESVGDNEGFSVYEYRFEK